MRAFMVDLGDLDLGGRRRGHDLSDILMAVLKHASEQEDKDSIEGVPREYWDKVAGEARAVLAEADTARRLTAEFYTQCPSIATLIIFKKQEKAMHIIDESAQQATAWLAEYDKRTAAAPASATDGGGGQKASSET